MDFARGVGHFDWHLGETKTQGTIKCDKGHFKFNFMRQQREVGVPMAWLHYGAYKLFAV